MSDANQFDLLATAKLHFRGQLDGAAQEIKIPEWEMVAWVRPPTLAQRAKMVAWGRERDLADWAHMLVERLTNDQGARIFSPAHARELQLMVASAVLERVAIEIINFDRALVDIRQAGAETELEGVEKK